MAIKITMTKTLEPFWGAEECYADSGSDGLVDLIYEDISALLDGMTISFEQVPETKSD